MEIIERLIPKSMTKTRPGIPMVPKYITVHTTDNYSVGADAAAHAHLQSVGNNREASWHYQVGSDGIYQSIPDNECAWHAGDGNGPGNRSSIAVEICVNEDGDFDKAKKSAIELIQSLMKKWGIPISNVVTHQHWSGKNCPREILKSGWDKFIAEIQSQTNKNNPLPYPGKLLKVGSRGDDVKRVQAKLGGLDVDGIFGPLTLKSVKAFQKKNKLDVDGIVGPLTWGKLFS